MEEKQATRDAWRRRQALTRRHGGRGRGRGQPGQPKPPGRRGRRGQPAGAGLVVPDQRDRYQEDSVDGVQGSREDYANWLSTSAKDSRELLRRQRVALPDVHEFTRFVLDMRHERSSEEEFTTVDEALDLGAIGACLGRLPIEVMLAAKGCEAVERDLVRRIEAEDAYLSEDLEEVGDAFGDAFGDGEKARDKTGGEGTAPNGGVPATDLAAELDAFLGLNDRDDRDGAAVAVERIEASTLEDDLAWFDQL